MGTHMGALGNLSPYHQGHMDSSSTRQVAKCRY